MYERFTERSRRILALANQAAGHWNHEYIGTEHILVGIMKEDTGLGAHVLKHFGMDLNKLMKAMEAIIKVGPEMVIIGKLPQTPRTKRTIELAVKNAREMNHSYVGTEHILLGLLEAADYAAADVLSDFGITKEKVLAEVKRMIGIDVPEEEGCLVCNKFNMCQFAHMLNTSDQDMMMSLFGDMADQLMAETFKFFGEKCLIFERES